MCCVLPENSCLLAPNRRTFNPDPDPDPDSDLSLCSDRTLDPDLDPDPDLEVARHRPSFCLAPAHPTTRPPVVVAYCHPLSPIVAAARCASRRDL